MIVGELPGAAYPGRQTGTITEDRCLHEMFEAQAARTPDATAIVCGTESWTYARTRPRLEPAGPVATAVGCRAGLLRRPLLRAVRAAHHGDPGLPQVRARRTYPSTRATPVTGSGTLPTNSGSCCA